MVAIQALTDCLLQLLFAFGNREMKNRKTSFFTSLVLLAFAVAMPMTSLAQPLTLAPEFPFAEGTAQYLGPLNLTGRGGFLYDLQPSVMYDAEDAARPFKMWWHGQNPGANPGDAIYFAHSLDGQNWSAPTLVLTPQLGTGGDEWADDHLLGAMSTIKIGNTYYMFYEAYASWVTPINRFFNFSAGDTWTTHGTPQNDGVIDVTKDRWERALGVAWRYPKSYSATDVSHPIYAGEVIHSDDKRDRFLSRTPVITHTDVFGSQFSPMYNGDPVFHLFDSDGGDRGRKQIYEFFDPVNRNTFVTDDPNGDGIPQALLNESLGYAASNLDTIDMKYAMQNQVMMATSTDGVHFTRFRGAGHGGSVASPTNAYNNLFDFSATSQNGRPRHAFQDAVFHWDIYRGYGSGFPAALVRDGNLELFFTDDSLEPPPVPIVPQRVFQIPVDQIENPQAYLDAGPTRAGTYYGQDVKWSPLFRRYFYTNFKPDPANPNKWSPEVQWSNHFGFDLFGFSERLPTFFGAEARGGGQGGLAGTPLGHTLDFPDAPTPFSAFHLYYAASHPDLIENYHVKDLDHVLVFGFHDDFRFDGVVTINGTEVHDGDTVDFGSVALGQSDTFELVYDWRDTPNFFEVTANAVTTGDFCDSVDRYFFTAGTSRELTYKATELGPASGTIDITVGLTESSDPLKSRLLPYQITVNLLGRASTEEELLGDVNQDGTVNFLDISPFIGALALGSFQLEADINQDGSVNFLDIAPFIAMLSGS